MGLSPFAILVLERDPYQWSDLPGMVATWAQDAGGFAFAGLLAYIIVALSRRTTGKGGWPPVLLAAVLCGALAGGCYLVARSLDLVEWVKAPPAETRQELIRTDKVPTKQKPQTPAAIWSG